MPTINEMIDFCEDMAAYDCFSNEQFARREMFYAISDELKELKELREKKIPGKWVDTGYGTKRCSVCGEKCQTYCMDKPRDRYCLWCGASMRKEGE